MSVRIATFNAENLMQRFDFSGFKNIQRMDRGLQMLDIKDRSHFETLEQARVVAHTDDTLQLTALAIADTRADIVCLQEVENMAALDAFENAYLHRMIGRGYKNKYLIEGNDGRGIDVCIMMREETATGEKIEFIAAKSHAKHTYADFGLHNAALNEVGSEADEKIFRRDCLEVDVKVGNRRLTLFVVHFKSMGARKEDVDGRSWTMPIRIAEAKATRHIIEQKFGNGKTANKRWLICGDMNDYFSRIKVDGSQHSGFSFEYELTESCGIDPLVAGDFSYNLSNRLPDMEQWTLYHSGRTERHLCQLDYILASPALADRNPKAVPEIIRSGQPFRTPFPPGQESVRYPRTGWDRPKASDHCPVVVELSI